MRCACLLPLAAALAAAETAPRDNTVCYKDLCDDKCILTNRKFDFPKTTNATHGMHSVVAGTLSKAISDITYKVTASFMGVAVPVTPGTGSACSPAILDISGLSSVVIDFTNGGTQKCPMAAGSIIVTPTETVSSSDPPMGKFMVNVAVMNGDGTMIEKLSIQVGGCKPGPPQPVPGPAPASKYACQDGKCIPSPDGVKLEICQAAC